MNQLADISATQLLSTGAMHFAEAALAANAHGAPPIGSAALASIDQVQQALSANNSLLSQAAEALKALQITAVLFTVQLTSGSPGDRAALRQLEDKLIERLEHRGAVHDVHSHDDATPPRLHARALDYARQIVVAEETHAPIGSAAIERSVKNLQVAAATFTMELARAEGRDSKELLRIGKLVESLLDQGTPS